MLTQTASTVHGAHCRGSQKGHSAIYLQSSLRGSPPSALGCPQLRSGFCSRGLTRSARRAAASAGEPHLGAGGPGTDACDLAVAEPQSMQPVSLPCLPFSPNDVFLPGQRKLLFLHEDHHIALLEAALAGPQRALAHAVVQAPPAPSDAYPGSYDAGPFIASHTTLASIVAVQRQRAGAWVTLQGEARLRMAALRQAPRPFLVARAAPLVDPAPLARAFMERVIHKAHQLEQLLQEVLAILARLAPSEERDALTRALEWADAPGPAAPPLSAAGARPVTRAARLSFAALQDMPGASPSERHQVLRARLLAMEDMDTAQRLARAVELVTAQRNTLSAKLALSSLSFAPLS